MDHNYGRQHFATRRGVSLVTCQGALGLDFKAVILCGLKSMGEFYHSKNEDYLMKTDLDSELIKEDFFTNINTLYAACTRAKDELVIVMTEDNRESIYSKILGKSLINLTSRIGYYKTLKEGDI